MNRKVHILILIAITLVLAQWTNVAHTLYVCNMQFPRSIKSIPSVRAYYTGNKITGTVNNENKQVAFNIPSYQKNNALYILITEQINWDAEENTIKYLKTDSHKPYKCYKLIAQQYNSFDKKNNTNDYWHVEEISLEQDGRIPDNTIIILFNPHLVESLSGGNSVTLPSIILYNDILDRIGTEEQLHINMQELLLSSIDIDSIHKKTEHNVKHHYQLKTVLALTT